MVNQEMKLVIGDVNYKLFSIQLSMRLNKQLKRKELAPMKKTLMDIDGALAAQLVDARPRPDKNADATFGLFQRLDGQLGMEIK